MLEQEVHFSTIIGCHTALNTDIVDTTILFHYNNYISYSILHKICSCLAEGVCPCCFNI